MKKDANEEVKEHCPWCGQLLAAHTSTRVEGDEIKCIVRMEVKQMPGQRWGKLSGGGSK